MGQQRVCPFYGQSIDLCDVGAGYISPYHVEVMVRNCTSRFEDCAKYQELTERRLNPGDSKPVTAKDRDSVHSPSGGVLLPLQLDKEVVTIVNHQIRTPLTSIRSFTEILLGYPIDDPEAHRHFLQIIHDESGRLSKAVDALFGKADGFASDGPEPSNDEHLSLSETTQVEMSL